jgi:DNA-binding NarL/FixJ family response regulator
MTSIQTDGRRTNTGEKIAELLAKGMTVLEIARLLNISPQAVYAQIHRHGLTLPRKATA